MLGRGLAASWKWGLRSLVRIIKLFLKWGTKLLGMNKWAELGVFLVGPKERKREALGKTDRWQYKDVKGARGRKGQERQGGGEGEMFHPVWQSCLEIFRPFTFNIISDKFGFKSPSCYLFCLSYFSFFSTFFWINWLLLLLYFLFCLLATVCMYVCIVVALGLKRYIFNLSQFKPSKNIIPLHI